MIRYRRKKSERGIALVTTLGILAVVSLLAASALVLSQYAEKDSYTFSSLTRSSYIAEGAANRLYWLILNDRKKYPQRNIDISDDALQEDEERFLADGTPHLFEDYYGEKVKYEIRDAVGGMDVSGSMPQRDLIAFMGDLEKDSAERERLEMIGNRLQDYVDSDDLVKLHGMEQSEYLQANLINLPRNRPFQYREEMLLIPEIQQLCQPDNSGRLTSIRLIAPQGLQPIGGRPSLYSSSISQIASRCRLTDMETAELEQAFTEWNKNKTPLKKTLPSGFLKRLEMYYGTSESGFYTVLIDTSSEQQPGIRLAVTFRSQFGNSSQLEFYEYMFY